MKKLKIYLDTSVISHLQHEDAPERTKETLLFWDELKTGKYEIVISDLTLEELSLCPQPKQRDLLEHLEEIDYEVLHRSTEVAAMAEDYIANGVLPKTKRGDCLHMAFATVSECDVIVSWNFKHMVRFRTIQGIRGVNTKNGYSKMMDIVQPTILLGVDANERTGN
jgi:predicted nucleic acid-binding protein